MKTADNKLSVWAVDTEDDLRDAFVALGSNCDNVGTLCAVKLSPDDLAAIAIEQEDGETPALCANQLHRNLVDINYVTLGNVISSVISGLRGNRMIRKTKAEMRRLLADAYLDDRLDMKQLQPSVIAEIKKELKRRGQIIEG